MGAVLPSMSLILQDDSCVAEPSIVDTVLQCGFSILVFR